MLMKNTDADREVQDKLFEGTAEQLRSYVERWEQLDSERRGVADQQKEVMAEAKSCGYDTRAIKQVIKLRKMRPDDLAEQEAVLSLYRGALGI